MSSTNTEIMESKTSKNIQAARVEIPKGAVSATQSHPTETIVIVLEGIWSFRFAGRTTTLKKDEVLRIPPHERYSSEALADTIALKLAASPNHSSRQFAIPHEDPDQYLWGV